MVLKYVIIDVETKFKASRERKEMMGGEGQCSPTPAQGRARVASVEAVFADPGSDS